MEYQQATQSAQKEQPKALSSSLHQTSLNRVISYPLLQLQRAAGNQAVQRMVSTRGHSMLKALSHTQIQFSKLAVSEPGDRYEQEADHVAEQIMHMPMPQSLPNQDVSEHSPASPIQQAPPQNHIQSLKESGQPLAQSVRAFMEPRFGRDLSNVRIHTGEQAAESANELSARAYTVGSDIVFGKGEYQPEMSEGRGLLTHELAHVVQQSQHAYNLPIQRKLKLVGDAANVARVLKVLNAGLLDYSVASDGSGNISLTATDIAGPPSPQQQALYNRLNTIISDAHNVTISVVAGGKTLVGSYQWGSIDIQDIEAFGKGPGATAASTLVHELYEQFEKQANGMAFGGETSGAHKEGILAESEVAGAKRGPQNAISMSRNSDGTIDAVVEIPYTYPDGKVVIVVMTVSHNNIIDVKRR